MTKRMAAAWRALARLREATSKESLSDIERDGMIRRFGLSFDLLWKCGKEYLRDHEGLEAASPKKVIRLLREVGLFDMAETEQFLLMADDRNMTARTYDEELAKKMEVRIRRYEELMRTWYLRMGE